MESSYAYDPARLPRMASAPSARTLLFLYSRLSSPLALGRLLDPLSNFRRRDLFCIIAGLVGADFFRSLTLGYFERKDW